MSSAARLIAEDCDVTWHFLSAAILLSRKYYEKSSIMSDPVRGEILSSLLGKRMIGISWWGFEHTLFANRAADMLFLTVAMDCTS